MNHIWVLFCKVGQRFTSLNLVEMKAASNDYSPVNNAINYTCFNTLVHTTEPCALCKIFNYAVHLSYQFSILSIT